MARRRFFPIRVIPKDVENRRYVVRMTHGHGVDRYSTQRSVTIPEDVMPEDMMPWSARKGLALINRKCPVRVETMKRSGNAVDEFTAWVTGL